MRHLAKRLLLAGLIMGMAGIFPAYVLAETLTADEIVIRSNAHDRERQAALEHYASERTYRVHYHGPIGERSAEVLARMEFSAPDQKHFTVLSESGSTIFCHNVLRKLMEGEQEGALQANHLRAMLLRQRQPQTDRRG
jgi:hypothetical protein